jgi:hypothetical protein
VSAPTVHTHLYPPHGHVSPARGQFVAVVSEASAYRQFDSFIFPLGHQEPLGFSGSS